VPASQRSEWEELVAKERDTVTQLSASLQDKERELTLTTDKLHQVRSMKCSGPLG
jgi:hypothetical protein